MPELGKGSLSMLTEKAQSVHVVFSVPFYFIVKTCWLPPIVEERYGNRLSKAVQLRKTGKPENSIKRKGGFVMARILQNKAFSVSSVMHFPLT